MAKGNESRFSLMNRGSKLRELVVESKVLYRIPGLSCKLADSWEGPYLVLERVGEVNYKIGKEGARKHWKVVHVNCLKKYRESGSIGRLDVVVEEEEEQRNKLSGECVGFDQGELDELLRGMERCFQICPDTQKTDLPTPKEDYPGYWSYFSWIFWWNPRI